MPAIIRAVDIGGVAMKDDVYFKAFDFEFDNGVGAAEFTRSRDEALKFPTVSDALQFWNTQSKTRPIRPDGKPNKPMTCTFIEVIKL